jgi:hypothetical protein
VVEANPSLLNRPTLLLYDCDTNKPPEHFGKIWISSLPKITEGTKAKKGIENLLPSILFESRFYNEKITEGDYGEQKCIASFNKTAFCEWICNERKNKADFIYFDKLVDIIKKFIAEST